MKSIIITAVFCTFSLIGFSQLNPTIGKEIQVQALPKVPLLKIDCSSNFLQPKAEYKPFIDYMLKRSTPVGNTAHSNFLNFNIKYTTVYTSDSAMLNIDLSGSTASLTADFIATSLDCSNIIVNNIPFTTLDYSTENYNVSLATNLGILMLKNTETNKTKSFSLKPIGYGIYTGSVTSGTGSRQVKETVVVVLTRLSFSIGG
ncbi:MAG: hypothetical protein U0T56_00945 [Ferruginibacter sp.]